MNKSAWIIGASTGLGRQLAETLAQRGYTLVLSARSESDLQSLCSHIHIKYNARAVAYPLDLTSIHDLTESVKYIDQLLQLHHLPGTLYVMAGSIHEQDEGLNSAAHLQALMHQNFTGPVLLINELIRRSRKDLLRIVVASSVAAARARRKNIAYGTAKRALEQYCSGLMHALADTNTLIQVYRFGYLDTNLSYGQKLPFPAADPVKIAQQVVADENKGPGLYYRPRFWWFISFVLNMVPFVIYKKLKF